MLTNLRTYLLLLMLLPARASAEKTYSLWQTSPAWLHVVAFTPALANLMLRWSKTSEEQYAVVKWHAVPTLDRNFELFRISPELYEIGDAMLYFTAWSALVAYNTGFSAVQHRKLYVLLQTLCMQEGIIGMLKLLIDRPRPDRSNHSSFPSGHASFTFAWASFIATDLYRQGYAWFYPYLVATFTAFTRVGGRRHYISDVIAGGLLGTLVGYYFYDFHFDARGQWRGSNTSWHVQPLMQLAAEQAQLVLHARTWW